MYTPSKILHQKFIVNQHKYLYQNFTEILFTIIYNFAVKFTILKRKD